jgi:hypothetical protein
MLVYNAMISLKTKKARSGVTWKKRKSFSSKVGGIMNVRIAMDSEEFVI